MKTIILSLSLLFTGLTTKAQVVQTGSAEMTFNKEMHDYGTIKQGANGDSEFTFTNTGAAPLILSDVKPVCGCTIPEWPKHPIKPGESGKIVLHYDTKRIGAFSKSVTIFANIEGGSQILRIKGTVEAEENAGAPVKNDNGIPKND